MKYALFKFLFSGFRKKEALPLPKNPKRILIIRQDNRIGNLIFSTPFLALVKKKWPSAQVDLLVGRLFPELLSGNPDIDNIIVYNQLACIRMPWKFFFLLRRLRKQKYDIVFDLKALFSFNNMMMTVLSGAAFRVGFHNDLADDFFHLAKKGTESSTYEPWIIASLLEPFMDIQPIPLIRYIPSSENKLEAQRQLDKLGLTNKSPVGIHTGGRGQKKLNLTLFLELAGQLTAKRLPVLFFVGPDEKEEYAQIVSAGFHCIAPVGVNDFGGFLPYLKVFVSCDTGPMHMAAGAGIATISLFTSSSIERYAPRGEKNISMMVHGIANFNKLVSDGLHKIISSSI